MINQDSFDHYKIILSLSQENIRLIKNPIITRQAELDFDNASKSWIIYYNIVQSEFPFIHELGHIYFAKKKTGYIYFAIPPPPNPELNRSLGNLVNNLLDCYVNYQLSEFEELYPIIRQNDYNYLDSLGDFQKQIKSINKLEILLGYYILFFLDFNYILKEEDSKKRNKEIELFLKILISRILDSTHFSKTNLYQMTKSLDKFKKEKNKIQPNKIVNFFMHILLDIDIWKKEELEKQMNFFFPEFKKF